MFKTLAFCSHSFIALLFSTLISTSVFALNAQQEVQAILDQAEAPNGVVFEIADWQDDALSEALPWVNKQILVLRKQFPGLDIAVVSHGSEQFALLSDAKEAFPDIHNSVQQLITDHSIKLELCEGHANMRGFNAFEFPDYVEIDGSGPSRISGYEAMGYTLVGVDI